MPITNLTGKYQTIAGSGSIANGGGLEEGADLRGALLQAARVGREARFERRLVLRCAPACHGLLHGVVEEVVRGALGGIEPALTKAGGGW